MVFRTTINNHWGREVVKYTQKERSNNRADQPGERARFAQFLCSPFSLAKVDLI